MQAILYGIAGGWKVWSKIFTAVNDIYEVLTIVNVFVSSECMNEWIMVIIMV